MSMASRGTRTWLKDMKPLSTLLKLQAGRARQAGGRTGRKEDMRQVKQADCQ
jgi:hypothetical protein